MRGLSIGHAIPGRCFFLPLKEFLFHVFRGNCREAAAAFMIQRSEQVVNIPRHTGGDAAFFLRTAAAPVCFRKPGTHRIRNLTKRRILPLGHTVSAARSAAPNLHKASLFQFCHYPPYADRVRTDVIRKLSAGKTFLPVTQVNECMDRRNKFTAHFPNAPLSVSRGWSMIPPKSQTFVWPGAQKPTEEAIIFLTDFMESPPMCFLCM